MYSRYKKCEHGLEHNDLSTFGMHDVFVSPLCLSMCRTLAGCISLFKVDYLLRFYLSNDLNLQFSEVISIDAFLRID